MATSPDNMPTHYETSQTTETRTTTMDKSYLTSKEGILKIVEMVLGFICFIIGVATLIGAGMGMLAFTGITSLITVAILFVLRLFTLFSKLPQAIPWNLIVFVHYAVWAIFYGICVLVSALCSWYSSGCGAGLFFTILAVIVFGIDAFFSFRRWRSGAPPSPEVTNTTTVTTVETQAHY